MIIFLIVPPFGAEEAFRFVGNPGSEDEVSEAVFLSITSKNKFPEGIKD